MGGSRISEVLLTSVCLLLLGGGFAVAQTLTSGSFKIDRQTIGASGHRVTSSGFILDGQFGQPVADSGLTSGSFQVGSGSFFFPPEIVAAAQEAARGDPGGGGLIVEYFMERKVPGFAPGDYDLNKDELVDLVDLSIFLYLAAQPVMQNPADFNRDLIVNFSDLSVLLFNWSPIQILTFQPKAKPMAKIVKSEGTESGGIGGIINSIFGAVKSVATSVVNFFGNIFKKQ